MSKITTVKAPEYLGHDSEEFELGILADRVGWHVNSPYHGRPANAELFTFANTTTVYTMADLPQYAGNYATGQSKEGLLKQVIVQIQGSSDADLVRYRCDEVPFSGDLVANGGYILGHRDWLYLNQPWEWQNFKIQAATSPVKLFVLYLTRESDT